MPRLSLQWYDWPTMKQIAVLLALLMLAACQSDSSPSTQTLMQLFYDDWDSGDYVGAVITADEIIERDPRDHTAYFNRGSAKGMLGRHREAIIDFSRVIEMNPGFDPQNLDHPLVMAYVNRGMAHSALGNMEEARSDWQAALEIAVEVGDSSWIGRIEKLLNAEPELPAP